VLGRNFNAKEAAKVIIDHVKDWDGFLDRSPRRRGKTVVSTESSAEKPKAEKAAST
jgi:hypothetical protein